MNSSKQSNLGACVVIRVYLGFSSSRGAHAWNLLFLINQYWQDRLSKHRVILILVIFAFVKTFYNLSNLLFQSTFFF